MFDTPIVRVDIDKVYEPAEDSFLLLDVFEQEKPDINRQFVSPIVLEIGTGSGIVTTFIKKHIIPQGVFLTTDLNPHACAAVLKTSKENNTHNTTPLDSLQCDLTSSIRHHLIDILIFNPPYVPAETVPDIPRLKEDEDQWLDLALLGGEDGMIVTNRLLDNLGNILSPNGVAYILFCARNKPLEIAQRMSAQGWESQLVINRKAGWEDLSVYKFSRK